jgi:hypothetical protein
MGGITQPGFKAGGPPPASGANSSDWMNWLFGGAPAAATGASAAGTGAAAGGGGGAAPTTYAGAGASAGGPPPGTNINAQSMGGMPSQQSAAPPGSWSAPAGWTDQQQMDWNRAQSDQEKEQQYYWTGGAPGRGQMLMAAPGQFNTAYGQLIQSSSNPNLYKKNGADESYLYHYDPQHGWRGAPAASFASYGDYPYFDPQKLSGADAQRAGQIYYSEGQQMGKQYASDTYTDPYGNNALKYNANAGYQP